MKKALLGCLLGVLMFTTVFVVYDSIVPTNEDNEVSVSDDHGGPFRRFIQRRKQQRDMRRQRQHKDVYTDGQ